MELVYLWVEDYKNIKKQGFDFSPRFKCEFKDEYNENGELKDNCELIIDENEDYIKSIYGSNIQITAIIGENGAGKSSIGGEFISKKLFGPSSTNPCLLLIENNNKLFLLNEVEIKIKINSKISISTEFFEDYSNIINKLFNEKGISEEIYSQSDLLNSEFNFLSKKGNYGENIYNSLNGIGFRKTRPHLYNVGRYIFSIISEFSSRDNQFTGNSYRVIRPLERKDINQYDTIIGKLDGLQEIINLLEFPFRVQKIKTKVQFITKDNVELAFGNLSFGQKFAIHMLASIYHRIKHNKQSIFFLDEVTLSMNPKLERRFIQILLLIVKKVKEELNENISVHFIITSHSPFILSDIPKQNVIFLKKDKETAQCINDSYNVRLNTFGANIHTLLADGFFMEEGVIGEFAKSKIQNLITQINKNNDLSSESLAEIKYMINMIGEPFLKRKLNEMINNKFSDIQSIDKEINSLEKKLEKLKNAKNKRK